MKTPQLVIALADIFAHVEKHDVPVEALLLNPSDVTRLAKLKWRHVSAKSVWGARVVPAASVRRGHYVIHFNSSTPALTKQVLPVAHGPLRSD